MLDSQSPLQSALTTNNNLVLLCYLSVSNIDYTGKEIFDEKNAYIINKWLTRIKHCGPFEDEI